MLAKNIIFEGVSLEWWYGAYVHCGMDPVAVKRVIYYDFFLPKYGIYAPLIFSDD